MSHARRLLVGLGAAAALAATVAAPAEATDTSATRCAAAAVLTPGNEVPGVDSHAAGLALVHIDGTKLRFSVVIVNRFRETFVAGHIHSGAVGTNGEVLVKLFSGSSTTRLFAQADSLAISEKTATAICRDLAGHYVNYHTSQYPEGAIRGQLRRL